MSAKVLEKTSTDDLDVKKTRFEENKGFLYAVISALCYTVSLSSLRGLTNYPDVSSDWSIAVKELTTVFCVAPVILVQYCRGKFRFPTWKVLFLITFAGVACQLVGARNHLIAYAALGLALATPLIQAVQLIVTSLFGALWLKESVTKSRLCALVLLIVAVWLLSGGNVSLDATIAGKPIRIGLGLFCVFLTALGYATQLSVTRKLLGTPKTTPEEEARSGRANEYLPTSLNMVAITGVGALICGACLTFERGPAAWLAPPAPCWGFVLTAGVANMIGFYFQTESLRRLFVLKQTMVANAQTITLTLAGLLFFHEKFTWTIAVGAILVAVGVAVAGMEHDNKSVAETESDSGCA